MIYAENVLSPKQADFKALAGLAFTEIPVLAEKIKTATGLPVAQAAPLLEEAFRFLYLIGYCNERLTPAILVDKAWHELILCTRHYHAFCQEHFGRYIHHHPGGQQAENERNFKKTIRLYQQFYGTPPEWAWGCLALSPDSASACGACSND